jgi:hypothetical protein
MKIERGVEAGGLRFQLTIHSADVTAHSFMSDEPHLMNGFADSVSDYARLRLLEMTKTCPEIKDKLL